MRRPTNARCLEPRPRPLDVVSYGNLRRACTAAMVPLEDPDGWALPDEQVAMAAEAARRGDDLETGAIHLEARVGSGLLPLGSRVGIGLMSWTELLLLASVLRSPVADGVAT